MALNVLRYRLLVFCLNTWQYVVHHCNLQLLSMGEGGSLDSYILCEY